VDILLARVGREHLSLLSFGSLYAFHEAIALCPTLFAPGKSEQGTGAKLAIIWFGTNDSIAPEFSQHVSRMLDSI
jgi:hypothetical protein